MRDSLDGVADFETCAGNRDGNRGNVIHFGDLNYSDPRGQTADNLAGSRILDFLCDALDAELVSDFQAGLAAEV